MSASAEPLPDWEEVLSAGARLQRILPDAVLVGRTVARNPCRASPLARLGCARIAEATFGYVCEYGQVDED